MINYLDCFIENVIENIKYDNSWFLKIETEQKKEYYNRETEETIEMDYYVLAVVIAEFGGMITKKYVLAIHQDALLENKFNQLVEELKEYLNKSKYSLWSEELEYLFTIKYGLTKEDILTAYEESKVLDRIFRKTLTME